MKPCILDTNTLIIQNVKDFADIAHLNVENWVI